MSRPRRLTRGESGLMRSLSCERPSNVHPNGSHQPSRTHSTAWQRQQLTWVVARVSVRRRYVLACRGRVRWPSGHQAATERVDDRAPRGRGRWTRGRGGRRRWARRRQQREVEGRQRELNVAVNRAEVRVTAPQRPRGDARRGQVRRARHQPALGRAAHALRRQRRRSRHRADQLGLRLLTGRFRHG